MKKTVLFLLAAVSILMPQTNTWVKATGLELGTWDYPGLVYAANTDEFVLSLGWHSSVYTVAVYSHGLGKWINALPSDTLYGSAANANSVDSAAGKWADSTGNAYGLGRGQCDDPALFGWPFYFKVIKGYLRPNPNPDGKNSRAYDQFCYNSDDGKIYYYINNWTFTHDPATRLWDTLGIVPHPASGGSTDFLKWGSLCYDAYNHEILLCAGGGIDKPYGSPGTCTYNPATRTWTKLALETEPSPRAHSPMVYDPVNHCIVLFGGDRLNCLLNDTWVYDCASKSWSKKTPAISPKPRAGHALLYLPKSGKIVLMGGYRYDNQGQWGWGTNDFEIWTYDVAANTWGLVQRMVSPARYPQSINNFPPLSGIVAVDKGDTVIALCDSSLSAYHLNPQTLRMACDASVIDGPGTTANGVKSDTVAYRGGWNNPSYWTALPAQDTSAHEAALRTMATGTWVKINPPETMPGDRTWGSVAFDPSRDLFMRWGGGHAAQCGTDVPQYSLHENRWALGFPPEYPMEYNGNNEPSPGPFSFNDRPFMPTHPVKSFAWDPPSGLMVHFQMEYTYLYNPDSMDWVRGARVLSPVQSNNPMATYYAGLVSTPHGVFGNWSTGCYIFSADSMKWLRPSQTGTLPGYFADACGTVYDSKRDRILYAHQSYGNVTTPARMWEYDFATNTASQLFPEDSALATGSTNYRDGVYVTTLDIVLFPIHRDSVNLAYDCLNNRWIEVPVRGFVSGMDDVGTAMMYDAKRARVWLTDARGNVYALRVDSTSMRAELNRGAHEASALTVSPTPFNPVTTLLLPKAVKGGSLRIFTADGRCVADLSKQAAVSNRVQWRPENLPTGIYVVKLVAGNKTWRTKAVLVK